MFRSQQEPNDSLDMCSGAGITTALPPVAGVFSLR